MERGALRDAWLVAARHSRTVGTLRVACVPGRQYHHGPFRFCDRRLRAAHAAGWLHGYHPFRAASRRAAAALDGARRVGTALARPPGRLSKERMEQDPANPV